MRMSMMSLTRESVYGRHTANSRSGAVWGALAAPQSSRIVEDILKPPPIAPISYRKASNMLEMNLMLVGLVGYSCGAAWGPAAARQAGVAVEPPTGAAWGCCMPEAAPVNGTDPWIQ